VSFVHDAHDFRSRRGAAHEECRCVECDPVDRSEIAVDECDQKNGSEDEEREGDIRLDVFPFHGVYHESEEQYADATQRCDNGGFIFGDDCKGVVGAIDFIAGESILQRHVFHLCQRGLIVRELVIQVHIIECFD